MCPYSIAYRRAWSMPSRNPFEVRCAVKHSCLEIEPCRPRFGRERDQLKFFLGFFLGGGTVW